MTESTGFHFLDGGGEVAIAIRHLNWDSNPLGPIEDWPSSLKTIVSLALNSAFPMWIVWGPELTSIYNDAFRPILGDKPTALGKCISDVWPEIWDTIGPLVKRAFAGTPTFLEDMLLTINRKGEPEEAYFTFCFSSLRDEAGEVQGMLATVYETTRKVKAERQAELLIRELSHRGKNMFAIVAAIARQTFQSKLPRHKTEQTLLGRIDALANAQAVLAGPMFDRGPIRVIIEAVLEPYRFEREPFIIEGPDCELSSRQALSLALAINELATNALKHGSLRASSGTVRITWSAGRPKSNDEFRLSWIEEGGPPIREPSSKGFGSRILTVAVPQEFGGKTQLTFRKQGLIFELSTTMAELELPCDDKD